jgi:hypothetical protein
LLRLDALQPDHYRSATFPQQGRLLAPDARKLQASGFERI